MQMELLLGPMMRFSYPSVRKKRSNSRRRPHPNPKPVIDWQKVHTLGSSQTDYSENEDIKLYRQNVKLSNLDFESSRLPSSNHVKLDENQIDKLSGPFHESGCLGNVNKPRKLKVKLGGIVRTDQTKYMTFDGGANLQKQDCYQNGPLHKKHAMDDEFDDEVDDEILYMKKLRASKAVSAIRYRRESRDSDSNGLGKNSKKKGRVDQDYDNEVEPMENFVDPATEYGREMTITTRKRALECPDSVNPVEFPNGLPDAPSKKQKLSEVERQMKKAEVAQRRKFLAEKAEAEAIRKILGQDSNRKKKEEKLKKQQEELAQEKTNKAATLGPSTVRWIIGPHGTIVTFSDDIGLPKIFCSQPYRYPPPREKCVGPNCMNEYKYRDSKSKLPLCSLHCYKAVRENTELLPAC